MTPEQIISETLKDQIEYCKNNTEYFIEKYIKIEDRDAPELAVPFTLWEGQRLALDGFIHERLNIVLKARQLGLTWLSLAYTIHEMLFNSGYQVVALSKKDTDAKELVRRLVFMLRYLPNWLIRENTKENETWEGIKYSSTMSTVTIQFESKESSVFTSFSASPDSGRSFTANLVIIDEWAFQQFAREIWSSAYPTINRVEGGKVIGLSTAKRQTLFEEIWKKAKEGQNTFHTTFLNWQTDPRRTKEWYEQTKRDLGELTTKQEYPLTPEEAFESAEGQAFPEFSYETHVIKPFDIPAHWKRWRSADNGYTDPFAWYWYTVSKDGIVYVYREYTRDEKDEKVIYTDQARNVKAKSFYMDFENVPRPEPIEYTVAGLDAWSGHVRDTSNKTLIDYYKDGGLSDFIQCNTDRALRKSTIHEYLKPYYDAVSDRTMAKVQIFSNCYKLIETLPQLQNDPNDNEKVMEDSRLDNCFDSFGYGLISRHERYSKAPQLPKDLKFNFNNEKPEWKDYGEKIKVI